jgi:hypothetical protein
MAYMDGLASAAVAGKRGGLSMRRMRRKFMVAAEVAQDAGWVGLRVYVSIRGAAVGVHGESVALIQLRHISR